MTNKNNSNFYILGVVSSIFSVLMVVVFLMNRGMKEQGGHDLGYAVWVALYLAIVSVALFRRSIVASFLFSVPCALVGLWLCVGSIINVPMPWLLLNTLVACFFFLPLYLSIQSG